MKIIFMGTPDFAVNTLEALIQKGHEVTCVVTQPDKPKGRGKSVQFSPVKECALSHQLPVFQPVRIREEEAVQELFSYAADIIVVVAFGQILPKEILEWPKYGCINVHASLLPQYRGAAPIQWAVIDGAQTSGVTIQKMDEGIDTGDIMAQTVVPLDDKETGGSLFEKLAVAGAKLCTDTIRRLDEKTVTYEKQEHEKATYAKMLKKQSGSIDWTKSAVEIERLIRGLNPWPSAYSYLNGKMLKIWKASVGQDLKGLQPGMLAVSAKKLEVQTKKGSLLLEEVQLEGKKRMSVEDFLRGYSIEQGMQMHAKKEN